MKEKERYELKIYAGCESYSITDTKEKQQLTIENVINILNQQDERIKELEEELDDVKRDYIPKLEFGLQRANKMGRDAEKENQQLKQRLADKEKYTYTGEEVGKIEQNYDNQLAIIEKALELACEHIKEDLKCDDTQDEIYNYFKNKAKEMLEK